MWDKETHAVRSLQEAQKALGVDFVKGESEDHRPSEAGLEQVCKREEDAALGRFHTYDPQKRKARRYGRHFLSNCKLGRAEEIRQQNEQSSGTLIRIHK